MSETEKNRKELQKASEAIHYELSMLNARATTLDECSKNKILFSQFTQNILIESFCVHLRNMIEFFGRKKKDCITYQYFLSENSNITFPHDLKRKHNTKVNNLLSHLTFHRLSYGPERKNWKLGQIANEVNENFKIFSENTDISLFCDKMKKLINSLPFQDSRLTNTTSDAIAKAMIISTTRGPTTFKRYHQIQ
jgi:hypothetical protein